MIGGICEGKSPSEEMFEALEDFGKREPTGLVLIWLDSEGGIQWRTSKVLLSTAVGMLEVVKGLIIRDKFESAAKKEDAE